MALPSFHGLQRIGIAVAAATTVGRGTSIRLILLLLLARPVRLVHRAATASATACKGLLMVALDATPAPALGVLSHRGHIGAVSSLCAPAGSVLAERATAASVAHREFVGWAELQSALLTS